MSGVYIKGMEMPTCCGDCPIANCKIDNGWANYPERANGCPLVPVPPHGRLIDADALYKDGWVLQKQVMRMGGYAIHEMPLTCPSLPTIIEAEGEE